MATNNSENMKKGYNTQYGEDLAKHANKVFRKVAKDTKKELNDVQKNAKSLLEDTIKTLNSYTDAQGSIKRGIKENVSELEKQANALKQVKRQMESYGSSLEDMGEGLSDSAEDVLNLLSQTIHRTDTLIKNNSKSSERVFANSLKISKRFQKSLKGNLDSSERLWRSFEKARFSSSKKHYADMLEEEQNAMANRLQWLSDYQEKYYDRLSEVDKKFFDTEFEEYKRRAEEIEDLVKVAGTEISNSISQQVKGIIESVRDIAIVNAAAQALSGEVDSFIDNKHQVLARTGRGFNFEAYRNNINRATQRAPYMSRNEYSEVYSDLIKEIRLQKSDELEYFARDIAAQTKAYGLSVDSLERLLWVDKNGGMQGTFRKVSNIAASLEDNSELYVSASKLLTSINDHIDKISYLQYKDSGKYTKMYKSLAVLEAVSQSSAMVGTDNLIKAVQEMGVNMYDMLDNDFARWFSVYSGAGSPGQLSEKLQNDEYAYQELILNYQKYFKNIYATQGEAGIYAQIKAGTTPWNTVAEALEFLNDDLDRYFNESIKSTEGGFSSLGNLTEDKGMESVTVMDKFQNEISGSLGWIADKFGELDIKWINAAAMITVAKGVFDAGTSLKGLFKSGKVSSLLGNIGSKASGGLLGGGVGTGAEAAGAGSLAGGGAAAGGKLAALGSTAALAAGVTAGGMLAYDGIKDIADKDSAVFTKAASGVEAAGGIAGAGALVALGVSNPLGWIALGIGGGAFLAKKIYESSNYLSGNAELLKEQYETMKQDFRDENSDRFKMLTDLKVAIKKESTLEGKKQKLINAGIASEKDLAGKSEESLNMLIDSYLQASNKMDEITNSMINEFEEVNVENSSNTQKELLKQLETAIDLGTNPDNPYGIDAATYTQAIRMLMDTVTDEDLLKEYEEAKEDADENGYLSLSDAKDLISDAAWFGLGSNDLGHASIDRTALEEVAALIGSDLDIPDEDTMLDAQSKALQMAQTLTEMVSLGKKDELKKYLEETVKTSGEALEQLKSTGSGAKLLKQATMFAGIPAFAKGISNVPNDGLAFLHEGEAVLTEMQAVQARADGGIPMEEDSKGKGVHTFEEMFLEKITNIKSELVAIKTFISDIFDDNDEYHTVIYKVLRKMGLLEGIDAAGVGGGGGGAYASGGITTLSAGTPDLLNIPWEIQSNLASAVDEAKAELIGDKNSTINRTSDTNAANGTATDFRYQDLASWSVPNLEDFNAWLNEKIAPHEKRSGVTSAFRDNGQAFLDAAAKSGLDPRYLAAHAILESAGGTDHKALKSHNYFGYGAFDTNVQNMLNYSSNAVGEGIAYIASKIANGYYNKHGQKSLYQMRWEGGNHKYATDPNWDTKIAEIMASAPVNTEFRKVTGEEGRINEGVVSSNAGGGKPGTANDTNGEYHDYMDYAMTQLGYKEGSGNKSYFGNYFGANNAAWCASFVSWALQQGGIKDLSSTTVTGLMNQAKNLGLYHSKNDGYTPKRGDIFINKGNGASHTGFVLEDLGNGTFTTVEGNTGNGTVKSNTRSYSSPEVSGFISMESLMKALPKEVTDGLESLTQAVQYDDRGFALNTTLSPQDLESYDYGDESDMSTSGAGGVLSVYVTNFGEMASALVGGEIEGSTTVPYDAGRIEVPGVVSPNQGKGTVTPSFITNNNYEIDNSEVVSSIKSMTGTLSAKLDTLIGRIGSLSIPDTKAKIPVNSDLSYMYSR